MLILFQANRQRVMGNQCPGVNTDSNESIVTLALCVTQLYRELCDH